MKKLISASLLKNSFLRNHTKINAIGDKKMMKVEEKIECWNCNAQIITYHDIGYNGKRGRCPICGVDFPLE